MKTIHILDLCCKAGGCSVGYHRAASKLNINAFIVGVDIDPQPNYPFVFIQDEAIKFLTENAHKFDFIHISPPCQKHTPSTAQFRKTGKIYREINIPDLREKLEKSGKPYVIENVMQAPIRNDIILRGDMFGLKVIRYRKFEVGNIFIMQPNLPKLLGSCKEGDYVSVFGKSGMKKVKEGKAPKFKKNTIRETWAYAMGVDWHMTDTELSESVPPAYTEYIATQIFKQLL